MPLSGMTNLKQLGMELTTEQINDNSNEIDRVVKSLVKAFKKGGLLNPVLSESPDLLESNRVYWRQRGEEGIS